MQYVIDTQKGSARPPRGARVLSSTHNRLSPVARVGARMVMALGLLLAVATTFAGGDDKYWDSRFANPGGNGLDTTVTGVAASNGSVYAVGNFCKAGDLATTHVAQWDGTRWSSLGAGPGYVPYDVCCVGDYVFTGGDNSVDAWSGQVWSTFYKRPDPIFVFHGLGGSELCVFYLGVIGSGGNSFYLCETEEWTGGGRQLPVDYSTVYKYDLGPSGFQTSGGFEVARGYGSASVRAIVPGANGLYGGGDTDWVTQEGRLWAQDGSFRNTSVHGDVRALAPTGKSVYVGGSISQIDDVQVHNIARWDGDSWTALGSGTDSTISAMVWNAGELYVAGSFTQAGETSATHVARWDGSAWSSLGSGLNGSVNSLALSGRALIAGGSFTMAGGKPSNYMAIWRPRVNVSTGTLSASPSVMTFGDDPYGYYKPALMTGTGTTVSYADALPTSFTLDQADVTTVAGQRVNGAFTLSPEGVHFGGDGAVLRVEFSEADVNAYGAAYTDFRAVRLARPGDAAETGCELLGSETAVPVRTDGGEQIYAIDVRLAETGGVYAAIPLSAVPRYALSLSAMPEEGGSVTVLTPPGTETRYVSGTMLTLKAISAHGYRFERWTGSLAGSANPETIVVKADTSVTARFAPGYTLSKSSSPVSGGSVWLEPLPDGEGKYALGTVVTVTAAPARGYDLAGWSGSLSGAANPTTVTVTGDMIVQANFLPLYEVRADAQPLSGGSVAMDPRPGPDGRYLSGSVVTLTAQPASGYQFDGWEGGLSGVDNPATIVVDHNIDVTAHFAPTDAANLAGTWSAVRVRGSSRQPGLTAILSVINNGTQDARGYDVQVFLSAGNAPTSDSLLVKTIKVRRQPKGRVMRFPISYRSNSAADFSGMRLIAVIDAGEAIKEQTERDNLAVSCPLQL